MGKDTESKQMEEREKPKFINAKRRGFIQGAAVAGGVAATGAAAAASEVVEATQTPELESVTKGKGYELTDHVRKYYEKARF